MAYLLDADVFIRAKNLHYGFDFCPAFLKWRIERNADGTVFSVENPAGGEGMPRPASASRSRGV